MFDVSRGDGTFLKARGEAKKGELDEQLKEYINEWRKQRSKEEASFGLDGDTPVYISNYLDNQIISLNRRSSSASRRSRPRGRRSEASRDLH